MSKKLQECGVALIDNRELILPWVLWYNIPSGPSLYASGTRNDLHCWERKATQATKATKATKSATVVLQRYFTWRDPARCPAFASAPFDLH